MASLHVCQHQRADRWWSQGERRLDRSSAVDSEMVSEASIGMSNGGARVGPAARLVQ